MTLSARYGVRYTVPQTLDLDRVKDTTIVRFRVADVYKGRSIAVYFDGQLVEKRKKRILAPGEMEQILLKKEMLQKYPDLKKIEVCTEVE